MITLQDFKTLRWDSFVQLEAKIKELLKERDEALEQLKQALQSISDATELAAVTKDNEELREENRRLVWQEKNFPKLNFKAEAQRILSERKSKGVEE